MKSSATSGNCNARLPNMSRRTSLLIGAALSAKGFLPGSALAQDPSGAIRFVVPVASGGLTDILARIVAERAGRLLGTQIVVENITGGGGTPAALAVARARPDGRTVLVGTIGTQVINPLLIPGLPYGRNDFAPVIALAASPPIIVAHPSFPADTLGELIALAKRQPGMVQYASPGIGSSGHLAMEVLQHMVGIRLQAIQYRGAAPSVQDLIAGRVLLGVDGLPGQIENVRAGTLKALAISDAQRSPVAPRIPTISETVPGFDVTAWYGLFASANSPPNAVAALSQAVNRVLQDPDVRRQLEARGFRIMGGTPEDLTQFIGAEFARWERVLPSLSIRLE